MIHHNLQSLQNALDVARAHRDFIVKEADLAVRQAEADFEAESARLRAEEDARRLERETALATHARDGLFTAMADWTRCQTRASALAVADAYRELNARAQGDLQSEVDYRWLGFAVANAYGIAEFFSMPSVWTYGGADAHAYAASNCHKAIVTDEPAPIVEESLRILEREICAAKKRHFARPEYIPAALSRITTAGLARAFQDHAKAEAAKAEERPVPVAAPPEQESEEAGIARRMAGWLGLASGAV